MEAGLPVAAEIHWKQPRVEYYVINGAISGYSTALYAQTSVQMTNSEIDLEQSPDAQPLNKPFRVNVKILKASFTQSVHLRYRQNILQVFTHELVQPLCVYIRCVCLCADCWFN